MSKAQLALRAADEFGIGISKARRFVSDVGPSNTRMLLSRSANGGRSFPWKTALTGTAVGGIGGGTLYWREQDIRKAEAAARESESYAEAVSSIADMDLEADKKRDLVGRAVDRGNNQPGGGPDEGPAFPSFFNLAEDPFGNIGLLLVALVATIIILDRSLEETL